MGILWPERPVGPGSTGRARAAFAGIHEGLAEARNELLLAARVDWVSEAAERYRALVLEATGDVGRLGATAGDAEGVVVRHTLAADARREARAVELCSGQFLMPVLDLTGRCS